MTHLYTPMKLYHFNPNTYAETYTVMAESREAAIEAVRAHLVKTAAEDCSWIEDPERRAQEQADQERRLLVALQHFEMGYKGEWQDRPYAIEVYEPGQVVQGEIC